ncbi:MAG: phosphoethanolamine transferase, partial [Thiohalomonadales bacterium]
MTKYNKQLTDSKKGITSSKLIILVSAFLMVFGNITFFSNVLDVYPLNLQNSLFLLSLFIVFIFAYIILLSLVCYKYTIKPILILIVLISSLSAYFMDTYHIVIDDLMIDNIIKTDIQESLDLFSVKQILYFIILGILPSIFIYRINISYYSIKKSIFSRVKLLGFSFVVIITLIFIFGSFYASFIREHKPLRYYANPGYYLYSAGKYIGNFIKNEDVPLKIIGLDSKIVPSNDIRKLIIFVVGESVRADHFSLNGYKKNTNFYLEKEDVISFKKVSACGTSTAYSVPCIFSIYNHSNYSKSKAEKTENVLDILQRDGINVIWLDNNSDSKGVADRIPYISYKSSTNNSVCDTECRDEGMLVSVQNYINTHQTGDIFIVLHQMGNHGPDYYKRYPVQFEKFTPVCKTNQLEQCTREEISNAYDNTILYTDYFLAKTIDLLKRNNENLMSTLFYVSDHGESLGENNIYLHGLPYLFAPETQTHVPLIMWFSKSFKEAGFNLEKLKTKTNIKFSHDNIFHTILGLMEVKT